MSNILLELAKKLNTVEFPPTIMSYRVRKPKNVAPYFSHARWAVRLSINRRQVIIGITDRLEDAARFADMAHLHFLRLGLRRPRAEGYNGAEAWAASDLQHPVAGPLLGEITSVLFPSGVPAVRPKVVRRTLRAEIAELQARVAALEKAS